MEPNLAKLARQLNLRNADRPPLLRSLPAVILMTDDHRLADPIPALARLPLHSMVIYRHYNHPDRDKLAWRVRQACRKYGHLFFVSADIGLATRIAAHGLHLPDRAQSHLRHALQTAQSCGLMVSASVHGLSQLNRLRVFAHNIDAVIISPAFATQSHPGAKHLSHQVFNQLACLAYRAGIAPYALGGINYKHLLQLKSAPLSGIAGIGFAT